MGDGRDGRRREGGVDSRGVEDSGSGSGAERMKGRTGVEGKRRRRKKREEEEEEGGGQILGGGRDG